jgi:hypothetical protein
LSDLLKKEKFRGAEFRKMSVAEEGVHFCEPEQGDILGEDDMGEDRIATSLMDYVESSNQHEDVLTEEPIEDREAYVFKYDDLCMTVGWKGKKLDNHLELSQRLLKMEICFLKE